MYAARARTSAEPGSFIASSRSRSSPLASRVLAPEVVTAVTQVRLWDRPCSGRISDASARNQANAGAACAKGSDCVSGTCTMSACQ